MTASSLKTHTVKDLASMAKQRGIPGWHAMRKEQLVRALVNSARAEAARKTRSRKRQQAAGSTRSASSAKSQGSKKRQTAARRTRAEKNETGAASRNGSPQPSASKRGKSQARSKTNAPQSAKSRSSRSKSKSSPTKALANSQKRTAEVEKHIAQLKERIARVKELDKVNTCSNGTTGNDRLILLVRDPYWLHAYWELSRRSIERVRSAMGRHWHTATPIVRLYQLLSNGVSSIERKFVRDIQIHGAVNNWYIDVKAPPACFQIEIGYLSSEGRFFALSRSNSVETPQVTEAVDGLDGNWAEVAEDFDRIYALSGGSDKNAEKDLREVFEEKLRRPMGPKTPARACQANRTMLQGRRPFEFSVDAEMIVHGAIDPRAQVTIKGQPVRVRQDGTFSVRFNLPERRLVLPVVASTTDGVEQHTIILAVERNTKVMEPVFREPDEV